MSSPSEAMRRPQSLAFTPLWDTRPCWSSRHTTCRLLPTSIYVPFWINARALHLFTSQLKCCQLPGCLVSFSLVLLTNSTFYHAPKKVDASMAARKIKTTFVVLFCTLMIFCSQAYAAQEPGSNLNVTLDFHQCGLDVISRNSQEPNSIVILDKDGKPTNNQAEAWGIPVEVCDSMCGPRGSSEAFDWPLFSAAIAQWLLPWLALTAQLPYETRDRTSNVMALILAAGSPMLITHSLCITILNSRWLNRYFDKLRSENETRGKNQLAMLSAAVYILKEI